MLEIRIDVDIPQIVLFSPSRATREVDRWIEDIERESAKEAQRIILQHLGRVLRHPTGFYESRIQIHNTAGGWQVDDGGVVYGPWLEGVGSRNSPVTRFKGYAHFRRARQQMPRQVNRIAERIVRQRIGRLT